MQKIAEKRWGGVGWGVAASIALHIAIFAVFFLELPDLPKAEKEETVNVELVPPPEEKPPEQPKPEEKKPEEQAKKEEPPPPPPPEEKKEEQAKKEPPPPPPPPPPEKPEEQAKAEEKKPQPDTDDKQTAGRQGQGSPLPVLRPVFQFGDKTTGPEKADAGNAPQGEAKPATSAPKPDATPEPPKPAPPAGAADTKAKEPPAKPVPDDVKLPEVAAAEAHSERNAPQADQQGAASTTLEQVKPAEEKPTEEAKAETEPEDLPPVSTLFSEADTKDPVARTMMAGIPRARRAADLCSTELREQLRHATPPYQPVIIPQYTLPRGTVMDVKRAAFRTAQTWYDITFRCEIDADAMKVVSFAFDVGDAVPRSEWRKRNFPEF